MLRMRAPWIGLACAALVAGGSWAAAPAGSQAPGEGQEILVASPRFVPAAGPVLAGDDRVAWVSRRDDRVLDLWVAQIGARPRRVQRFSGSDEERLRPVALIASATAVGLELEVTQFAGRRRAARRTSLRAYAGAFGEPLAPARDLALQGADGVAGLPGAGAAARDLARHADTSPRRVIWVQRACASAEIRAIAAPASDVAIEAAPRCRLRLRRAPSLRGSRLRLRLSCAGFRIDCRAEVRVRARGLLLARGTTRYNHSTPPYSAADLRLTSRGMALLRSHPRVRLRISAQIGRSGPMRRTTRAIARR